MNRGIFYLLSQLVLNVLKLGLRSHAGVPTAYGCHLTPLPTGAVPPQMALFSYKQLSPKCVPLHLYISRSWGHHIQCSMSHVALSYTRFD